MSIAYILDLKNKRKRKNSTETRKIKSIECLEKEINTFISFLG